MHYIEGVKENFSSIELVIKIEKDADEQIKGTWRQKCPISIPHFISYRLTGKDSDSCCNIIRDPENAVSEERKLDLF